jgi:hypothetical protein
VLALLAVLVFDLFSIAGGAHYWLHYLIQLAVPVAALAGILAARSSTVRWWSVCAVVTAFVGWVVLVMSPPQTAEELVGQAIGRSATSHDTIVVVPGRSNVGYAAGLRSPYPYLWALPARTLDPGKAALLKLLSGPRAPTWLVSWRAPRDRGPDLFREAVAGRYRQTARICGQRVYVRRDVARPRPVAHDRPAATKDSRCESVSVLPPLLRGLL